MKSKNISSILIVFICILCIFTSIVYVYGRFTFKKVTAADHIRSEQIYTLLKKGKIQFEKNNKHTPTKFSQFVQLKGALKKPCTITLQEFNTYFYKPDSNDNLEYNQFQVKYKSGLVVDYYIDNKTKEIKTRIYFKPWKSVIF